jgi:HlyD family secretion protein
MASRGAVGIALGLILVAAGVGGFILWHRGDASTIVGVVRTTEVRVAPEVGGQLAAIKVQKGTRVRAGEVVAELSALELTAAVAQARAALAAASASRDHVYAGVRDEEIAALASEIDKAKSRLAYAQSQLDRTTYLARSDTATQQALDQATNDVASASADVAEAEANHDAAVAGPTKEERAIADTQVEAAAAALAVLERRLDKTVLRAPADGVVSVIVAEVGENIRAGQPCWPSRRRASSGCRSTCGRISCTASGSERPSTWDGWARAKRPRRSSPRSCRWGHLQLGKPSARSVITTATRCACASIPKAIWPNSNPG